MDAGARWCHDVHSGVTNPQRRARPWPENCKVRQKHFRGTSRLVNTAISELDGGIPRREEFPLRLSDVIAVLAFWALLALISAAGRELDPRVPGLSAEVTSAVVRTTYVEYTLWALLTVPILWLTSRFSIERGRRVERMLMFAGLGLLIAVAMNAIMLEVR
jgi:hypothetical protein